METQPEINALVEKPRYTRLMAFVGATYKGPLFYIQRTANETVKGKVDPQKSLHSDTFHPRMKGWYFFGDVSLDKGAFNSVPGSHRLTWKGQKWEYGRSIDFDSLENVHSKRGSIRPSAQDVIEMGHGPAQAMWTRHGFMPLL